MTDWQLSMGPAVANHLWQSTAFAVAIWGATLLLRRNQARVRYGLWLVASAKFVVPFALLIAVGGMLPRPKHTVVTMPVYSAVDEVGLPFSDMETSPVESVAPTHVSEARHGAPDLLPTLPVALTVVWLCGTVVVLAVWCRGWLRVMRLARGAVRVESGREVEALRRVVQVAGVKRAVEMRLVFPRQTDGLTWGTQVRVMEPGIFGVFRPVLIWPERLSERLDDEHIEAILAHELMHVRRRDNLAAAIHMLVEAAFWFHPLVWWIQRRMVEERERACDEAVVELGSRPGVYAESLLKAVRFCVESPLVCVAGVTGADLKKRVRSIMTLRLRRLGVAGKIALATLAVATIAVPVAFGVVRMIPMVGQVFHATGPLPSYDVVVIKPSQEGEHGADTEGEQTHYLITAKLLIQFAYGVFNPGKMSALNVVGGPDWINTEVFDIVGKTSPADFELRQKMNRARGHEQRQLMEQSLLADRFKLKMHTEMQDQPVYALTVIKGGPKMTPAKDATGSAHVNPSPGPMAPEDLKRGLIVRRKGRGFEMTVKGMTLDTFIDALTAQKETEGKPVVDQTGLTAAYDFTLVWGPEETAPTESGDAEELPLFTAIQQQLGLKLVSSKAPAEVVVIDHIEKPVFDSADAVAKPSVVATAVAAGQRMLGSLVPMPAPAITTTAQYSRHATFTNSFVNLMPIAQAQPSNQSPTGGDQKQVLHGAHKVWLEQDVRWIITDQEAQAFKRLMNDEERDKFIEQFWLRRNPEPGASGNAYREEIYARIAYANEHFAADQPGWMTDRGHVYIVYGKPDEIDSHPSAGMETWHYRYIPEVGENLALKFVDASGQGDYRMAGPVPAKLFREGEQSDATQPEAGAEGPNPLKRRLTDAERTGGVGRAAPTPVSAPAFEVATVKPAAPLPSQPSSAGSPGMPARRIPGAAIVTITSDRASYRNITLKSLLMKAYGLEPFQVSGPAWIDSEHYDVLATIPQGTSKEEVPVMLQHLLAERFRMTLHSETKEQSGYILGIGKGGSKLKVSAGRGESAPMATAKFGTDSVVETMYGETMPAFAHVLFRMLGRPVIDSTGLSGQFDIVLTLAKGVVMPGAQETAADGSSSESDSSMASLFTAVQDLGLTLSSDKVPLKCIVVDKAEKIPTEN